MTRMGTPMYSKTQDCFIFVTIEDGDSPARIRRWRGSSARKIKAAARMKYPGATLGFGAAVWITR